MFGQKPGAIRQQRPDNVSLNAFPVTNRAAVSARSSRRSGFSVARFFGEARSPSCAAFLVTLGQIEISVLIFSMRYGRLSTGDTIPGVSRSLLTAEFRSRSIPGKSHPRKLTF